MVDISAAGMRVALPDCRRSLFANPLGDDAGFMSDKRGDTFVHSASPKPVAPSLSGGRAPVSS